jgi:DNA N-6-adenine-methyltransferase (Dam)
MGAHQSSASAGVDWLTPPVWLDGLGKFDLDPCVAERMPWPTAPVMWTRTDNGLQKDWFGRVWCNPPYGPPRIIEPWMARMADHNNGVALIFARTDTACWHKFVFPVAIGALFVQGRPNFHTVTGAKSLKNCGAPVALLAYGVDNMHAIAESGIKGKLVIFNNPTAFDGEADANR